MNHIVRPSGSFLLTGTVLIILTMVLHPSGGSMDHIRQISGIAIGSHSIAIASVPFLIFGTFGLTWHLRDKVILSYFAFTVFCIGGIIVILAATVNGLVLPVFVEKYATSDKETIDIVKVILGYNHTLNQSFDWIFIASASVSTLLWSVAILAGGGLPRWSGLLGILTGGISLVMFFAGFVFTDLGGFRIFMTGFSLWLIIIAVLLMRTPKERSEII